MNSREVSSGKDLVKSKIFLAETVVSPGSKIASQSILKLNSISKSVAIRVIKSFSAFIKILDKIGIDCLLSATDANKDKGSDNLDFRILKFIMLSEL